MGTVDKHVWRCILNILNNVPLSALMTIPGSELQIVGSVTENALPFVLVGRPALAHYLNVAIEQEHEE